MYEGTYTDGKSAVRHRVRVTVTMNRLHIADESGRTLDEWPLSGLRLAEDLYSGSQPVRLSHRQKGDARLFLPSQEILDRLAGQVPGLRRRRLRSRILVQAGMALAALGILLAVLLAALPYAADRLARFVPRLWEESIGAGIIAAFGERFPDCSGADGRAALASLANRIAGARGGLPRVRIHVLKSRIPNAFALPGGHIGIFEGLIRFIESPEEMAGVLAHEMAHVAHRHPMKSILRQSGYRLIFSAMAGDASFLGTSAAKITETLLNLSFTREAERESDRSSILMLNRAGIRSDGLARFLSRLEKAGSRNLSRGGYFSTHPAPGERARAMRGWVRDGKSPMTPGEWRAVRRMCRVTDF
ncbi:MAG: M48 family metallopeptidase [bacterium]